VSTQQPQNNPLAQIAGKAPSGSVWRNVLTGALAGLAASGGAKSFGAGVASGAAGDISMQQQNNAARINQQQNQQVLQQQLSEGSARLAHAQLENQILQSSWDKMPKTFQDTLLQESAQAGQQLKDSGNNPVMSGLSEDAANQLMTHLITANPNQASNYSMFADGKGNFEVFQIQNPNKLNASPIEVTTSFIPGKKADGSLDFDNPTPVKTQVLPGSVKVADALASPVMAAKAYWESYNKNQTAIQKADETGVTDKNEAAATKAQAQAKAAANGGGKQVVGFDPQNGDRVITSAADGQSQGLQQMLPVKVADVEKYRTANAQFGNVQAAKSNYLMAAKDFAQNGKGSDIVGINSAINEAHLGGGISILNGQIEIPGVSSLAEAAGRVANSAAYKSMSPSGQNLVDSYLRMMAAVPEYQKAATGIGRSNKEMLDLELKNVPDPTMPPAVIIKRLGTFQDGIDRNSQGLPRIKGAAFAKDVREQIEGPSQSQSDNFTIPPMPTFGR
jgi:hypothetical protein